MHNFFAFFFFVCFLNTSLAQSNFAKADDLMKNYKYAEAIIELKPSADKGNIQAVRRIAECYRKINDYANAEKNYAIVVVDKNTNKKNYLYYGQMLMNNSKYIEAEKWLQTYLSTQPKDSILVKSLIMSCLKATQGFEDIRKVSFRNLEKLNSTSSEFCAVAYNNDLIFTSSREGKTNGFDGQSFAKVYSASLNSDSTYNIKPLSGVINSKSYHSGPASINIKNDKIYYTKNNIQYGNAITNKKGDVTLKIFEAKIKGNNTSDFKELPFNTTEYSCAYPSINKEGDVIYFTSDKAGGYGGKDIYYSIFKNDKWSKPKNAGNIINTSGDERYPFIHDDGTLYFSSNGHQGYGGLDIFKTILNDSGVVIDVQNLGTPFNSSSDDFGFYLDSNSHRGYISSDRAGGLGSDDIYEFVFKDIPLTYQINFKHQAIDSVCISITYKDSTTTLYTNEKGMCTTYLQPHKTYLIAIHKEGFKTIETKLRTYDSYKPINRKTNLEIATEEASIINTKEESSGDEQ